MKNYLNFENEIKNLETELEKLKDPYNQSGLSEVDTQKISKKLYDSLLITSKVEKHLDSNKIKKLIIAPDPKISNIPIDLKSLIE